MFMPQLVHLCLWLNVSHAWMLVKFACWLFVLVGTNTSMLVFEDGGKPCLNAISAKSSPHMNVGYSGMMTVFAFKNVTSSVSHVQAC